MGNMTNEMNMAVQPAQHTLLTQNSLPHGRGHQQLPASFHYVLLVHFSVQ
jgi:hypothetical protein